MATGTVQPLPPPPPYSSHTYPPIIIVLTVILLVFFFFGFFSIYFCRCFMENIFCAWHLRHSRPAGADAAAAPGGLDPSIVRSFPTFAYSTVKDYRKEKYGLECAICLVEFEGSDVLRLLTACCHVFHQECIDLWLGSHDTCPVCRRKLDSPPVKRSPSHFGGSINSLQDIRENEVIEDCNFVSVEIKDDRNEDESLERRASNERVDEGRKVEKLSKSHSTGHSIVVSREKEEDRYTLILPEHVKSDIIRGHNSSKSWTTFGEYKAKSNTRNIGGLAEVSGSSAGDNEV